MIAEACDGLAAPAPVKKGRAASSKSASKSTAAPSSAEDSAKPASSGRKGHEGGNRKRKEREEPASPDMFPIVSETKPANQHFGGM